MQRRWRQAHSAAVTPLRRREQAHFQNQMPNPVEKGLGIHQRIDKNQRKGTGVMVVVVEVVGEGATAVSRIVGGRTNSSLL